MYFVAAGAPSGQADAGEFVRRAGIVLCRGTAEVLLEEVGNVGQGDLVHGLGVDRRQREPFRDGGVLRVVADRQRSGGVQLPGDLRTVGQQDFVLPLGIDREGLRRGTLVEGYAVGLEPYPLDCFAEGRLARVVERETQHRAEDLLRLGNRVGNGGGVPGPEVLAREGAGLRLVDGSRGDDSDLVVLRERHGCDGGEDHVAGILRLGELQRHALRAADLRLRLRIGDVDRQRSGDLRREGEREFRDSLAEEVLRDTDAQQMHLVVEMQRDGVAVVSGDEPGGVLDGFGDHDVPLAVVGPVLYGGDFIGYLPGGAHHRRRNGIDGVVGVFLRSLHGVDLAAEQRLLF